jgi:hypothetical protein
MRGRFHTIAFTALFVCALIAAGCGGDDDDETTTTTPPAASAEQRVDDAVQSCTDQAQELGGSAGTALGSACTSVGNTAKQALSTGGENVNQALSQAESSCTSAVGGLPSGQAQAALSNLCDAISSAE